MNCRPGDLALSRPQFNPVSDWNHPLIMWQAVWDQLRAHRPQFHERCEDELSCALVEIRRLQALDRPTQDNTADLQDAALELLAALSITSQDARERAIRRMCEALKAARGEGQS